MSPFPLHKGELFLSIRRLSQCGCPAQDSQFNTRSSTRPLAISPYIIHDSPCTAKTRTQQSRAADRPYISSWPGRCSCHGRGGSRDIRLKKVFSTQSSRLSWPWHSGMNEHLVSAGMSTYNTCESRLPTKIVPTLLLVPSVLMQIPLRWTGKTNFL